MNSIILKYKQPRESRLIAGLVGLISGLGVLFFSKLVALESFADYPVGISLFMHMGIIIITAGLYFAMCIPVMEIDKEIRTIIMSKSCVMFQTRKIESFLNIKEVGIKELYYAGDRTEETGTSYYVEVRARRNIEVPGSKSQDLEAAIRLANEIASYTGIRFNQRARKVFNGGFKLQ